MYVAVLILGVLVFVVQLGVIQAKPTDNVEEETSLTAEIHVDYSRPSDFTLEPPNYRVASSVELTCVVHGAAGHVSYSWSSTGSEDCFAQGIDNQSVSALILRPADSGSHTCTATDFVGQDCNRTTSASVEMNIVGSGIFDERVKTALPNNGIIVTNQHVHAVHFYCWFSAVDNDTTLQFIDVNGTDITSGKGPFKVTTTTYGDSAVMEIVAKSSSLYEQGVYTCRVNEGADLNVGIFPSELSTAPTITSLQQDTSNGLFVLECISTGSPPTNVVWTKDGIEITIDGTVHKMTQSVTDRATSTYKNVLVMEDSVDHLPGEYSCEVSNSFGVSNPVNITARVMQITGHEEVLIVGLTVHISCTTSLKGNAKIQWLLGGFDVPLESSTTQKVVLPLELESTGLDGAMFTCRITGLDGAVYDETITLKVKDFENIVTTEAPEMPLTAGNTYSISCVVTADVQGTVEWADSTGNSVTSSNDLSVHDPVINGKTTTLTLHFNPLHTSHGDRYTCISTVDVLQSVKRASEDVIVQIPVPVITVSRTPAITPIYTTSLLNLTCDVNVDKAVDTPVEISSMWTGPEGVFSGDDSTAVAVTTFDTEKQKTLVATLDSLESSDSGSYVCEASISPVSTSAYIVASNESSSQTLTIVIALNVSIRVSHTPPIDVSVQPHNYRAGTSVTLYCEVAGASGPVAYRWTSTCSGCFVSGTHSSVSRNFLRSTDAGLHTCTVTDSIGNSGSTTIPMNVTGAGVYVLTGTHTGAIPNNSLVIARTSSQSLQFYCVSNSTTNGVGRIIGKLGSDITWASSDAFVISHYNPGGLQIVSPYSYRYRYYYGRYETRYTRVSSQNEGIYTCKIPDARGSLLDINFGIYRHSFNTPPRITHLRHATSSNLFTIKCTSTGSPATVVTWAKDGTNLTIDESQYQTTQRVTSRSASTYLNVLYINGTPASIVGMYTCRVSNILGTSSREISVKGIQITGYEETFEVGEAANVACRSDLDVLNIEWHLDEDSTSTTVVTSHTSVNELKFSSVTASVNNAQYTCHVTSPYGVQSKSVTLHAKIPTVWASVNVAPIIDATDGEDYYLTCTVTVINGLMANAVSVTWLGHDGSVVSEDNTTTAAFLSNSNTTLSSRLSFQPLKSTHGGNYTCKATIMVPGLNEPPPMTALAQLVVTSVAAFQLKFGPVEYCIRWTVDKAKHMEQAIKAALTASIRDQCNCSFSVGAISDGEFSCQTTITEVVYRSKINGTSDMFTAPELLAFVEDWITNKGTFTVDVFRLRTSTECPLHVQSFHQPECSANATISSIPAGVAFVTV